MTAIPARVAGVARGHRRLPAARCRGLRGGTRGGRRSRCSASAARTRSPHWPTAPRRSPRVDKIVGPGNAYVAAAKALVADRLRDRLLRRTRARSPSSRRRGRADWIAADLIAQAEHDPDARAILITPSQPAGQGGAQARSTPQMPADGPAPGRRSRATAASSSRATLDEAIALGQRLAPEHLVCDSDATGAPADARGHGVRRRLQRPGLRRLRHRLQPRAADQRRRRRARRAERRRFRARLDGPADHGGGASTDRARGRRSRACRRADRRTPRRWRSEIAARAAARRARIAAMTHEYERVVAPADALAPAPEREHRGLLTEGARRHPGR